MNKKSIINHIETDNKLISILKKLPNNYWDFKYENTKEYTHSIHSYPAVMVSPISRNIINIVRQIMEVDSLFDPFSGSGTVLVEGMLANIKTIYGNDINPLAIFISKVKTNKLNINKLKKEASILLKQINDDYNENIDFYEMADEYFEKTLDLTSKDGWGNDAPVYLKKYVDSKKINFEVPNFKNIGYWFKPRVILQLQMIKNHILKIEDENIRNFVFAAFSESVRLVSNRRNGEFKMFRMPPIKVKSFKPNVLKEFTDILDKNIEKMNGFAEACNKNGSISKVRIFNNNVIDLFDIDDSSIDLVITSPPYGDNRTTVAYGEYSRLSLQWIDLFGLSEKEIMMIDKTLMGGAKFRKGFEFSIPSKTLTKSLEIIKDIDLERAGDVYSFYLDLEKAISAISKKTKTGGYQFWVVGNRTVKGELLKTDKIIKEIASKYDMDYVYTIDRNIINKVMPSLNSPTNTVGKKLETMCNEHIVILRKR
ncbi:DNA methylase [uncultured Brachyspira sp.]|uniref:DNA methylase n=2 Tax=uncultured Brachyspira sp. TaxID=221953 RepID=UPI00261A4532|nr:DNA methylase [uncultured Brachyspira sp.]